MAQVRKYLQGSTVVKKPVLIDIAGNLYDVQSIRDITYKNLDLYITNKQLNDESKAVILDYYNYLFPAMQRGEIKYTDLRPKSFIVAPEWESDGTFNVTGHGLLKHDITNDKKAGINFGTDLIYELINQGVIKPYVAPEKKSLPVKDELEKKIKLKYFNDNDEAFKEGWKNSNTEQRRLMILGAFSELEFDPDLYNGVDTFNAGKSSFMDALQGDINDDLYLKFNSIGGYGLAEMLGMKTSTTSGSKEEEVKPLTRDEAREKFRKECIDSGVLEDYVEDCVEGKMTELDTVLSQYKLNLEFQNNFNNLQKAYSAYNEYSETNKGQWYASYKDANYNITYNGLTLPDYSKITNEEYHRLLNLLRELIVDGTIDYNLDRTLGILDTAADNGMLLGNGAVKAVVGSENWKDKTVIAVIKSVLEDGRAQYKVRIMSMFDFPEIYENLLHTKFIKQYNEQNGLNLGSSFYKEFEELLRRIQAAQTALSVLLQKLGGILKAKAGDALLNWARYDDPHYKPVVKEPESNEEPKDNSKDITTLNRKINRPLELKDYQVAQLVGLGGDIALTIGSLSGGFVNPLTYGGAAASIGGYTYSDLADPNVSVSLALGNLGGNIVLAGLDFIPVIGGTLGAGTRTLKALNTIRKITPWLISAFAMINATPGAIKALLKANDPKEKLSFDDWKAIGHGISAVLAAVRAGGINRKARPGNKETGEGGAYGEARSRWDTKYKNKNKKGTTEEESVNRQEEQTNTQEEQTAGQLELTGALRELLTGVGEERANGGEEQAASHLEELAGKPRFILITKPEPFKQPIRTETSKQRTRKSRESVMAAFGVSKGNTSKLLTGSDAETRIRAAENAIHKGKGYIVTDRDKVVRIVSRLKPGMTEISPDATVYIKIGNSVLKSTLGDALLSGYSIKFNKRGGFITNVLSKYLQGGLIPKFQNSGEITYSSITGGNTNSWYDDIFSAYFSKMLELIDSIKDDDAKLDEWIKNSNDYQRTHSSIFKDYDENNNSRLSYSDDVKKYLGDVNENRGYINEYGITNGWKNNRYVRSTTSSFGDGVKDDNGNYSYSPDGLPGKQTYDRRIFGLASDFDENTLANVNSELNKRGIELYEGDNGYMYMRRINNPNLSDNATNNSLNSSNQSEQKTIKDSDGNDISISPVLDDNGKPIIDKTTGHPLYKDTDGKHYTINPETNIATGADKYNKGTLRKIFDKGKEVVTDAVKNLNEADVIALIRMLRAKKANEEALKIRKELQPALAEPIIKNAILQGDYISKTVGLQLAGKINAIVSIPNSSSSKVRALTLLEGAIKGSDYALKGALADAEAKNKSILNVQSVDNENRASIINTANANVQSYTAMSNAIKNLEADTIVLNEHNVVNPYLAGVELRYRLADVLAKQAAMKAAEAINNLKFKRELDKYNKELAIAEDESYEAAKNLPGFSYDKWYRDWLNSAKYKELLAKIDNLYIDAERQYYESLSPYFTHLEFRKPTWATPGIVEEGTYKAKKGGSLSFTERVALKMIDNTNKNIREANRETNKNIRDARKNVAQMSKLTEDLLKKAVGIK